MILKIGVIIMLAIWFVVGALVALIFRSEEETLAVGKLVIIVKNRQVHGTIEVHDTYLRLRIGQG